MHEHDRRQVAVWLLACCLLVFAMVVVGGITRLTHSGLSIVEWEPLVGTVPPLSAADWEELFEEYKATPQYHKVNKDMSLEQFKGIFWWEYLHRLLGRAIGVVFFLPFLWFLLGRKIDGILAWKLGAIFLLGALQGAMGWYMVASGLVDDPRVSQYRLTAHLGIAFLIFGAMLWTALDVLHPARIDLPPVRRRLARNAAALSLLIFIMVLSGGFVAGIRAGLAYNTFPLMNGNFVPPEILTLTPWWTNFFNNMATVQFNHRLIAWLLIFLVPLLWISARRADLPDRARVAANAMLAMLAIQAGLGIGTLLLAVPVPLAVAHQGGAVLLFGSGLWLAHAVREG
jgi:cytochrome c oxidase assembly protein subunit 15